MKVATAATAGLLAAAAGLTALLTSQVLGLGRSAEVLRAPRALDTIGAPLMADGVDARDTALRRYPRLAQHLVTFVVRYRNFGGDRAFWQEVASALPSGSRIALLGFCDGSACGGLAAAERDSEPRLLVAADLFGEEQMLEADRVGSCLVADRRDRIEAETPWRGRDAASVARQLVALP